MGIISLKSIFLNSNKTLPEAFHNIKYERAWMNQDGKFTWIGQDDHIKWALTNVLPNHTSNDYVEMYKRGWVRITKEWFLDDKKLTYENNIKPVNKFQRDALVDYGMEHSYKVLNSLNPREILYSPRTSSSPFLESQIREGDPDHIEGTDLQYGNKDARTFIISRDFNLILYAEDIDSTHYVICSVLVELYEKIEKSDKNNNSEIIKSVLEGTDRFGNKINIKYEGSESDLLKLSFFAFENFDPDGSDENDDIEYFVREEIGLAGRLWKDNNVISFWQRKKDVLKYLPKIKTLISLYGKKIENFEFDFLDSSVLKKYSDLVKVNVRDKTKKLTPDQIKDLLKKQHIDPNAKEKLKDMGMTMEPGSMKQQKIASKAGFPHAAAFKFAHPFSEIKNEILKNKDSVALPMIRRSLKENPEDVYANDTHIAGFRDSDAYSFVIDIQTGVGIYGSTNDYNGVYGQVYHRDILDLLFGIGREISDNAYDEKDIPDFIERKLSRAKMSLSGSISNIIKFATRLYIDNKNKFNSIDARKIGIVGRLWKEEKIISFWNQRDDLIQNEKIIRNFVDKEFSNAEDYDIDYIGKNNNDNLIPYDEFFNIKSNIKSKMTPKEIEDLMKKQHIDPNAKEKLQAIGMISPHGSLKQQKVSFKAGYPSVAAFKFAHQVTETKIIKLKSFIKSILKD